MWDGKKNCKVLFNWFKKVRGGEYLNTKLGKQEGASSLDYGVEGLVISTAVLIWSLRVYESLDFPNGH